MEAEGHDAIAVDVQDIGAQAAVLLQRAAFDLGGGDQVDGDVVFVDLYIGVLADRLHQGPLDFAAGDVLGMQDAPGAVAPFAGQVVVDPPVGGELDPPFDQVADGLRPFLHHHPDHILVADAGPGHQGVFDMGVEGVLVGKDRGDAALGVLGGRFGDITLGNDGDAAMVGCLEGKGETGNAAADHQKITFDPHDLIVPS